MKHKLLYICDEKSLKNLIHYQMLNQLFGKNFLILTTEEIETKVSKLQNLISYSSSWTHKDIKYLTDYLYLQNFFQRRNKPLNIILRTRIFGSYKIRTFKNLASVFRQIFKFLKIIDWKLALRSKYLSAEELIFTLRKKELISQGDSKRIFKILNNLNIESAICISTLRDPRIFDFVDACTELKIKTYVMPDSWDNISSNPAIPKDISEILVWSEQQKKEIQKNHKYFTGRVRIFGSYRISKGLDLFNEVQYKKLDNNISRLKILYLEGYIYEIFEENLRIMVKALLKVALKTANLKDIEIIVRRYPGPKQSEGKNRQRYFDMFAEEGIKFLISESTEKYVVNDLPGVDLVISDCTTAALECLACGYTVIFIGSSHSPRYLDTMKIYDFSFSKDLKKFFPIINLSKSCAEQRLFNEIYHLICNTKEIEPYSNYLFDFNSPIKYFAIPISNMHLD